MSPETSKPAGSLLIGSTLGFLGGLFLVVVGRSIIEAVNTGTYETVFGLEIITSLVAWTGVIICIVSIFGIMIGVSKSVR